MNLSDLPLWVWAAMAAALIALIVFAVGTVEFLARTEAADRRDAEEDLEHPARMTGA